MSLRPWSPLRALVAAALLCGWAGGASARPNLDAARIAELTDYRVLVFGDPIGNAMERGKAIGLFDATPEEVFRVATDFARWQEYLPRVKTSRVVQQNGRASLVALEAELPWPAGKRQVIARYLAEKLPGEIYRIRFEMVQGEMKQYVGSIYIEPWAPPGASLSTAPLKATVTYELVADPDVLATAATLNRMIKRSASGFVHALRQRINDLHKLGLLHPLPPTPPAPVAPPLAAPTTQMKARVETSR